MDQNYFNGITDINSRINITKMSDRSSKLSETFGMFRKVSEIIILRENGHYLYYHYHHKLRHQSLVSLNSVVGPKIRGTPPGKSAVAE